MAATRLSGVPWASGAVADRHQGTQRDVVWRLAPRHREIAEPASDHGEDDVIHRPAECLANGADVIQPDRRPVPSALGPDLAVDRRRWSGPEPTGERQEAIGEVAGPAGRPAGAAERPHARACSKGCVARSRSAPRKSCRSLGSWEGCQSSGIEGDGSG